MRRKFDYKGEYIKDKNGRFVFEDVDCPMECEGIISDIPIGVPLKYKAPDGMQYVDLITKTVGDKKLRKYVYIIPKKYLHKINQTALVLSWNKLRVFSGAQHNYRVIMTKPSIDYAKELNAIRDYWLKNNIMFNPADCELDYQVNGVTNLAMIPFDGVLDEYVMFDVNKALGQEETLEDYNDDINEEEF